MSESRYISLLNGLRTLGYDDAEGKDYNRAYPRAHLREAHDAIQALERELAEAQARVSQYMDIRSADMKRIERLEKIETSYYEQQASHTEARGMLCQERDRAIAERDEANADHLSDMKLLMDAGDSLESAEKTMNDAIKRCGDVIAENDRLVQNLTDESRRANAQGEYAVSLAALLREQVARGLCGGITDGEAAWQDAWKDRARDALAKNQRQGADSPYVASIREEDHTSLTPPNKADRRPCDPEPTPIAQSASATTIEPLTGESIHKTADGCRCTDCGKTVHRKPNGLVVLDYSSYNAPFCHHPEKCGPVGRCLREIACND